MQRRLSVQVARVRVGALRKQAPHLIEPAIFRRPAQLRAAESTRDRCLGSIDSRRFDQAATLTPAGLQAECILHAQVGARLCSTARSSGRLPGFEAGVGHADTVLAIALVSVL